MKAVSPSRSSQCSHLHLGHRRGGVGATFVPTRYELQCFEKVRSIDELVRIFPSLGYQILVLATSRGRLNRRLGHTKTFAVWCSKLHSITVRCWSKIRARRVKIKGERCRAGLLKALEGMPSERKLVTRKTWISSLLCSFSGQRTGPSPLSKSMLDRGLMAAYIPSIGDEISSVRQNSD